MFIYLNIYIYKYTYLYTNIRIYNFISVQLLSRFWLFVSPWITARQASLSMEILQATILEWVAIPFSEDLPNPGIEPRSPALGVDSLLTEPPGKPKNTVVGSLSLFQGIFLTQELNQSLLHWRQILFQLSYQGSSCMKSRQIK